MKKGIKRIVRILALSLFLQSCSPLYKTTFDCPIPEGIPCTSLTEIESMIVERNEGSDLLVEAHESYPSPAFRAKKCECQHKSQKRFWFCDQEADNGIQVKGKNISVDVRGKE